jgi:methionine transaminase
MTPTFTSKLPNTPTTIFTIISALALEHKALNLGQGMPDFNCHPDLQNLVAEHIRAGHNQYAPMPGIAPLREAISEKYMDWLGVYYNPATEITITAGATEALYASFAAFVQPGDELILLEPCYDLYAPSIEIHGGKPVYYSLSPANNYKVDWQAVKALITPKTRAIVVNTPQNPSSSIFLEEDLNQLAAILSGSNVLVIADEVYEHIVFDGEQHWSVMRHPQLRERSLICGSFGKTYHTTGWKLGYLMASPELSAEFRKIHQWVNFSVNTPIQHAYAQILKDKSHYLDLTAFFERKKKLFLDNLAGSRFQVLPSRGSFFQSLSFRNISSEGDFDLAVRLTKQIGVASIPMSVFYHDKRDHQVLRFCFAKGDAMLIEAAQRLKQL